MNFQTIPPVDDSKALIDLAFSKARAKAKAKEFIGERVQNTKKRETLKIDVIKDQMVERLDKITRSFPSLDHLPEFYIKLLKLTLNYKDLKHSLGAVNWLMEKVKFFQKSYARKIMKSTDYNSVKKHSKEFYGRISSVAKQVDQNLTYLEACRRVMKTYPDIKEMFTICIYGYPNIGKTTLLNKLTGSTAKTAAYSFTTVSINCAYFDLGDKKVQVLDVPGTLARKDKMNLIELQAELVLDDLANLAIFIFDLTEPYPFSEQKKLYEKVKKAKKTLVYLSKTDLLSKEQITEFEEENIRYYSMDEIKKEILDKAKDYVPPEKTTSKT
ncbi:MAG: GTPase [archaeon]|nr:50S ribosome-binding GTPase [Nanoarchaeota archaeon]